MSSNDDLDLDDLEMDLSFEEDSPELSSDSAALNEVDLSIDELDLSTSDEAEVEASQDSQESPLEDLDLSFDEEENLEIGGEVVASASENSQDLSLSLNVSDLGDDDLDLGLSGEADGPMLLSDESPDQLLNLSEDESQHEIDFSEDAKKKLKEIDEILVEDASRGHDVSQYNLHEEDEEKSFEVSDSDFLVTPVDDSPVLEAKKIESKPLPKKESKSDAQPILAQELQTAYTGELERFHATISNLRADRADLEKRIHQLEASLSVESRRQLELRSELDEKKVELTIIKKRLQDEISELKERNILLDEKKQLLDQKIQVLETQLLDFEQKNRFTQKRGSSREKELEEKLELLKVDSDTQIKHRDQKILELKRKIDHLEFDLESASRLERKSLDGRVELQEKLDKAVRTLKNVVDSLEDSGSKESVLKVLKKNAEN